MSERVMIYPSGRAATLAGLSAIPALGIALVFPAYWYAGLIIVVFILVLTAADALATATAQGFTALVEAPALAYVGQDLTVTVGTNEAGDGALVEAAVEHDERLVPMTSARGIVRDAALDMSFVAARRGVAEIGALWLRWRGPLGLVWKQRRQSLAQTIAIVPDIRPARAEALRLFRRDGTLGEVAQLDPGAGGEFQSLTKFGTGMDRRAIDWKHSARHGKLLAKEYRTDRNNDIVFAIDSGRLMCEPVDGVPRMDCAVSAALSAAFVALKLGDKVSLFGFDSRPRIASGAVSGVSAFNVFQRLAAQLDYSNEETNYTFALTALAGQLKRRSLVLVFTDFVDPTSAELMLRTVGRLAERHLVLFVLMHDVELEALAATAPTTPADISRAVIAAAMLRERRIVIARLRRLGVHIVEAAHDRLGPELVNAYIGIKKRDLL